MYIPPITFRCRPSTFRSICDEISSLIGPEEEQILKKLNIHHFLKIPPMQQNVPLIVDLLSLWNPDMEEFVINGCILPFTSDDVSLITGLPNKGQELVIDTQLSFVTAIDMKNKIKKINRSQPHYTPMYFVVNFIKFLLSNLLFPLNNYKIPNQFLNIATNVEEFTSYNWAHAIWKFLVDQLPRLAMKIQTNKKLGYLNGFVPLFMIWFFEHTSIVDPNSTTARPRILRWPKEVFFNASQVSKLFINLRDDQIFSFFRHVTPVERELLSPDYTHLTSSPNIQHTPSPDTYHTQVHHDVHSAVHHDDYCSLPSTHFPSPPNKSPRRQVTDDRFQNISDFITNLSTTMNYRFDILSMRIGHLETKVSVIEADLTLVQNALAAHHTTTTPTADPTTKVDLPTTTADLTTTTADPDPTTTTTPTTDHTTPTADLINHTADLDPTTTTIPTADLTIIIGDPTTIAVPEELPVELQQQFDIIERRVKKRFSKKRKFVSSPFIALDIKSTVKVFKQDEVDQSVDVDELPDVGHHQMKRSFPWEEKVTISLDDSSDSDSEKHKQDRAKRDKKDCSSENHGDILSEDTLIRMAGMYQDYMKRIAIPTFSGSVVPFTSWQGLAKSLKQVYGQPLHYLTNSLLKQWDRERFGSDNESQPLDALVHPLKAQTLIWLTEELHRLTVSPYYLAKLWASDPMYHSQIDPFLSY